MDQYPTLGFPLYRPQVWSKLQESNKLEQTQIQVQDSGKSFTNYKFLWSVRAGLLEILTNELIISDQNLVLVEVCCPPYTQVWSVLKWVIVGLQIECVAFLDIRRHWAAISQLWSKLNKRQQRKTQIIFHFVTLNVREVWWMSDLICHQNVVG